MKAQKKKDPVSHNVSIQPEKRIHLQNVFYVKTLNTDQIKMYSQ